MQRSEFISPPTHTNAPGLTRGHRKVRALVWKRMKEDAGGLRTILPSSLVLSPLWETCPPLDGPGVPTEGVEWASSMSLQDAGFWEVRQRSAHQGTGDKEKEKKRGKNRWGRSSRSSMRSITQFPKTQRKLLGMICKVRQQQSETRKKHYHSFQEGCLNIAAEKVGTGV